MEEITKTRKDLYLEVNARIKKTKTQLMQDLYLIEKEGLWEEGGFTSFEDWAIKEHGWGSRYLDMHRTAAKFLINSTMSHEQKSKLTTENQIRVLKQLPKELHEQVMEKIPNGEVTAKKIKETAVEITEKVHKKANDISEAVRVDEVGYKIPQHLITEWDRVKDIVREYRKSISFVRSDMDSKLKAGDLAFSEIRKTCVDHLSAAWEGIKLLDPYAVCTACNGQAWFQKKNCITCSGRGWLSKHYYDTFIERSQKLAI